MIRSEGYMLVTRDIDRARLFYINALGATVSLDIGTHVIFEEGFSLLQEEQWRNLAELENAALCYKSHTGQLVFEVDDILVFVNNPTFIGTVKDFIHPLKELPWGRRAIRFYDPDGHVIEVGESMKVVVKRFLSQGYSIVEVAQKSEFPEAFVLQCQREMIES